jgi:hypothetical protein
MVRNIFIGLSAMLQPLLSEQSLVQVARPDRRCSNLQRLGAMYSVPVAIKLITGPASHDFEFGILLRIANEQTSIIFEDYIADPKGQRNEPPDLVCLLDNHRL